MNLDNFPILLNIRQASRLLGIHPDTLRDWDNSGRLPAIRLGSRGDRRWSRDVILSIHQQRAK